MRRFFTNSKTFVQLNVKQKLSFAFLFLIVMMCVTGGGGVFYIDRIRDNLTDLTDTAAPLFEMSNSLVYKMQEADACFREILRSTDAMVIQAKAETLKKVEDEFNADIERLNHIITEGNVQIDIQNVMKAKEAFFMKLPEAVSAHQRELEKESSVAERLDRLIEQIAKLDKELTGVVNQAKAAINEKEDRGKTLEQSGDASVEDMSALLNELLNQDYYLVDGGTTFQNYLVQMADIARTYINETDIEELPGIKEEYERVARKARSRTKRLKSRLRTSEGKTAYKNLEEGVAILGSDVLSEGGLFDTHLELLKIKSKIQNLQTSLYKVGGDISFALTQIADEAREINEKAQVVTQETVGHAQLVIAVLILVVSAIGFANASFIVRSITNPLNKAVEFSEIMAGGDFSRPLEIKSKDEFGVLADALNNMAASIGSMINEISMSVDTLTSASTELSAISQQMATGSKQTAAQAAIVATGAKELNLNTNAIVNAMEETSTSVGMITPATNLISSTIDEIAKSTEQTRTIAAGAVAKTQEASTQVSKLGDSANAIGTVVETITEISDMVNLLALNATIEAARAGDAGKGFAVVANEIKELAQKTAEATEEVKDLIHSIQTTSIGTVDRIASVSDVVAEVNNIVEIISSSMEEQSVTTREIADNVALAATGISEVNQNVAQSSTAVKDIAQEIDKVSHGAAEMSSGSVQVSASAQELSKLSEQLKASVARFKV